MNKKIAILLVLGIFCMGFVSPPSRTQYIASMDVLPASADNHSVGTEDNYFKNGYVRMYWVKESSTAPDEVSTYGVLYTDGEVPYWKDENGTISQLNSTTYTTADAVVAGDYAIKTNNDLDDFTTFSTANNIPRISVSGGQTLVITNDTGSEILNLRPYATGTGSILYFYREPLASQNYVAVGTVTNTITGTPPVAYGFRIQPNETTTTTASSSIAIAGANKTTTGVGGDVYILGGNGGSLSGITGGSVHLWAGKEGAATYNSGNVEVSGNTVIVSGDMRLINGNSLYVSEDITVLDDITASGDVTVKSLTTTSGDMTGVFARGTSGMYSSGDIVTTRDVVASRDVVANKHLRSDSDIYASGDISTTGTLRASDDVVVDEVVFNQYGTSQLWASQDDDFADDHLVNLPTSADGIVMASCRGIPAVWGVSFDGTVLRASTSFDGVMPVASEDADGYFCCYDAGTNAAVKNRLGRKERMRIMFFYD